MGDSLNRANTPHPRPLPTTRSARGGRGRKARGEMKKAIPRQTRFPPPARSGCSQRPEPIEASSPRCRTARRCASGGGSVQHEVAQAEGPERIAMEWWRDAARQQAHARLLPRREQRTACAPGSIAKASTAASSNHRKNRNGICTGCLRERDGHSVSFRTEAATAEVRAAAALCRAGGDQQFFLSARAPPISEELVETAKQLGLGGTWHCRSQQRCRRRAGACDGPRNYV